MNPTEEEALKQWLASRPECVQKLAAEFPPGTRILFEGCGTMAWVIGWTEDDAIIITKIDPKVNYKEAVAQKSYICAAHLRDSSVFFPQ